MRNLLAWWRARLYSSHLGEYMKRWIFQTPFGTVRLHKIMKSDEYRHYHDHPWNFRSLILKGKYLDVSPVGDLGHPFYQRYRVGQWNRKRAKDLHRLVLVDGPVWTLVFTGPKLRRWGFLVDGKWIHWREYRKANPMLPWPEKE